MGPSHCEIDNTNFCILSQEQTSIKVGGTVLVAAVVGCMSFVPEGFKCLCVGVMGHKIKLKFKGFLRKGQLVLQGH